MGDELSIGTSTNSQRQIREVSVIFLHPTYNMWTFENDIAVIRVCINLLIDCIHTINLPFLK